MIGDSGKPSELRSRGNSGRRLQGTNGQDTRISFKKRPKPKTRLNASGREGLCHDPGLCKRQNWFLASTWEWRIDRILPIHLW